MALSGLLEVIISIREGHAAQLTALNELEKEVTDLLTGRETERIAAWQQAQEHFDTNIVCILLHLISRTAAQVEARGQIDSAACQLLSKALSVLQGLLFLHHNSARLFERRGMLETLLILLKVKPATATTSESSAPSAEEHDELINQTLSALLAVLVDRPRNAKVFEQIGGLADIADLLRSKAISKSVRYACLELLFFYLAPEEQEAAAHEAPPLAQSSSFAQSTARHPHRHSLAAPVRSATPPVGENTGRTPQSPGKKRPWSARPSVVAEMEHAEAPSTPQRRELDSSRLGTPTGARFETPAASRPFMPGTPLVKSPSTPEQMSEALADVPTGSSSTPNTPERPRTSRHQSNRLSSIMALPPRPPLSATPSAPQLLASTPARSRMSASGIGKSYEPTVSALRKSSLSPGQSRSSLAFSTPSPSSPKKRDSFVISRDITPMSKSRPASAVSPSKRASISGIVRGPSYGARAESMPPLGDVGEAEVFSTMVMR